MKDIIIKSVEKEIKVMMIVEIMKLMMMKMMKGDKEIMIDGEGERKEKVERIRVEMGIDKKKVVKIGKWMWNILNLDIGSQFIMRKKVQKEIEERIKVKIQIEMMELEIKIKVGIIMGVVEEYLRERWLEKGVMRIEIMGV